MNLPQYLNLIDSRTANMSRDELAASIHQIARVLPEERRDWLLSVIGTSPEENIEIESAASHDLYEQLDRVMSGEIRLDSDLNEAWDDWYASDEPEFLFEDNDGILPVIQSACSELHRLVDCAAYEEASRLGKLLLELEVQVDGEYSDYDNGTLNLEGLSDYELVTISVKDVLLDTACAVYFIREGQERAAAIYQIGKWFRSEWTLEELMQHAPAELPDIDSFLTDWICYLQTIPEKTAEIFLQEALQMQHDPVQALETARQSSTLHPEVYEQVLSMQENDAKRLEVGLEALNNMDTMFTVRSSIALQTAEAALRLGDNSCAEFCYREAFRSDSNAVNYIRALLNNPDYKSALAELQTIASDFHKSETESCQNQNILQDDTKRLIRFISGEFQDAYADLYGKYDCFSPNALTQGIALIALFLYPDSALQKGGEAMCRLLTTELPFHAEDYKRGLDSVTETDSTKLLWDCLRQCRAHMPLPEREAALEILQKHFTGYTAYVMDNNKRYQYTECAALASVIGEILEAEGRITSKNAYLLECKALYTRRIAYHRELRSFGMNDGKR
ncbi:MAG: hypothetical protein J6B01_09425 [Ruminococcus sp.]|nr:hypothetical protein [Ruminococcus sp.]